MSTDKILKQISKLDNQVHKLYGDLIQAFLKEHPEIKEFALESSQEYDDNNYYYSTGIFSINKVELPEILKDDYILEELENEDNEDDDSNEDWNRLLMAAKIKAETLGKLLGIVQSIPNSYFENLSDLTFTLKKAKKSAKTA